MVMLTSSGQYGEHARYREVGIASCLTKPVSAEDLIDAIGAALSAQPTAPQGRTGSRENQIVEARTSGTSRVLLVEDNAVNQRVAAGLLRRRGHTVVVVENGREAVDITARELFDVVLMDVQMPVMGGLEATALIREREGTTGGHLRIVAMTAHAMTGDRERCLAAGMDAYVSKPIDPDALFAAIEQPQDAPEKVDPQQAATGTDVFDPVSLKRRVAGDEDLMVEVIKIFTEECPVRLAAIEQALAARDAGALRAAAHNLKGAAGNLAAMRVFEAAHALETVAAEDRLADADVEWRRLSSEAATLLVALSRQAHHSTEAA
jgi:CheY-like chemotaxis protein